MVHIQGDLVFAVGVWIAAVIITINPDWKFVDPLCTFLFSIIVLKITIPIVKDSSKILMEAIPDDVNEEEVREKILKIVEKVSSLKIWAVTQDYNCCNVHVMISKGDNEQKI